MKLLEFNANFDLISVFTRDKGNLALSFISEPMYVII